MSPREQYPINESTYCSHATLTTNHTHRIDAGPQVGGPDSRAVDPTPTEHQTPSAWLQCGAQATATTAHFRKDSRRRSSTSRAWRVVLWHHPCRLRGATSTAHRMNLRNTQLSGLSATRRTAPAIPRRITPPTNPGGTGRVFCMHLPSDVCLCRLWGGFMPITAMRNIGLTGRRILF